MSTDSTRYDALLVPSDGRQPHLVELMTTPMLPPPGYTTTNNRVPHPEIHMDFIAKDLGHKAWKYQLIESLDGMKTKFTTPYIIFYPVISRDGMAFPINKVIQEIQGRNFREPNAWRGSIVIAKYRDNPFSSLTDISIADYPLIRNWLMTHYCPGN